MVKGEVGVQLGFNEPICLVCFKGLTYLPTSLPIYLHFRTLTYLSTPLLTHYLLTYSPTHLSKFSYYV
jgi:hypothetical protein